MKLKLLSLMFVFGLFINTGCSLFNGDEAAETESAEASDPALDAEGADAAAEMDKDSEDLAEDEEVASEDGEAKEEVAKEDEELPEESLEETSEEELVAEDGTAAEGKELEDGSISDNAETKTAEAAEDDESVFDEETPAPDSTEMAAAPSEEAAPAPLETPAETMASTDSLPVEETPAPAPVSLKKIKEVPYKEAGMLMNSVYLARAGDTWKGVSEKIYGENKSKDLKKGNPYLSYRELKVGDKVYYNSPKRPEDAEKMLTYYEDNGIPAQSYVAKAGDNIRAISQNLLGHENSWKEVWSTNLAVDSKGELPEGTEIRYWTESAVAAAPAEVPAEAAAAPEPVAPAQAAATPPPPAPAPQDDFSLPDDMQNQGAAAGTAAVEPPPPPPPPAPAPQKTVASNNPMDKDLTFMLSAGGLLLVGVGVLLGIVRKSKARKMSMNTHTQI